MTDSQLSSLMFEITTISVNSDTPETNSVSDDSEETQINTLPEIYSRFIEVKQLLHNNLASYISFEKMSSNRAIIISESYSYNLEKILASRMAQKHEFKEEEVKEIMIEILKGLYKLASHGLPYLSMCLSNILITSNAGIKLAHPADSYLLGPENCIRHYSCPEELSSKVYLFKLDSWALGTMMIECLSLMRSPGLQSPDFEK